MIPSTTSSSANRSIGRSSTATSPSPTLPLAPPRPPDAPQRPAPGRGPRLAQRYLRQRPAGPGPHRGQARRRHPAVGELDRAAGDRASISTATTHDSGIGNTIFKPATQLPGEISLDRRPRQRRSAARLRAAAGDAARRARGGGRSLTEQALLDMILDRIRASRAAAGVVYLKEEVDGEYYQAATCALPGYPDRHPALAHAGARGARQGHGGAGVRRRHRPALRRLRGHHDVRHPLDGGGAGCSPSRSRSA